MITEKILGNIKDTEFQGCSVDYVGIEWYEAFQKIHRKTTRKGRDMGMRFDDEILTRGLMPGDVIYREGDELVAVELLPCDVLVVKTDDHHPQMSHKVCYEIGNRHAALFWGEEANSFITPYTAPLEKLLGGLHGVTVEKKQMVLPFDRKISSMVHNHTHE